jgi:hypothetical protein
VKIIGDRYPDRGANRRNWRRLEKIDPGDLKERVKIGVERQRRRFDRIWL